MNCGVFRRAIYHFQADELPSAERGAFEDHLNACPPCADLYEVEQGLLRGLKARLAPAPAPPGLETRIRDQLARASDDRRPGVSWFRTPRFAALATTILLAVVLLPSNNVFRTSPTQRVARVVTLVDRACDLAGRSYEQQRGCDHPGHLNVLKLDDGTYWGVSLDDEESRLLMTDRAMRGTRMRVEGMLYERIRTLQLETVLQLGPESARLAPS